MLRRHWLACMGLAPLAALAIPQAWAADAPALLLANVYRPGMRLADYWVSEKYDGVRGFWDGHTLRTRGGETVAAPAWVLSVLNRTWPLSCPVMLKTPSPLRERVGVRVQYLLPLTVQPVYC